MSDKAPSVQYKGERVERSEPATTGSHRGRGALVALVELRRPAFRRLLLHGMQRSWLSDQDLSNFQRDRHRVDIESDRHTDIVLIGMQR